MVGLRTEHIAALSEKLLPGKEAAIVTHAHPDGDALGSSYALLEYLTVSRGMKAHILLPDTPADTVSFIVGRKELLLCNDSDPKACLEKIARSGIIFLLDGNNFSRAEGMEAALEGSRACKVLIDHHIGPALEKFDISFSETEISSASELLYYILLGMPDIDGVPSRIPAPAAAALLTGMTTDTNNFANSVFPSTFAMASDLIAAGVDRNAILDRIYRSYRENRVRIMGWLQSENMVITPSGAAYIIATKAVQERFSIREGEMEGLVNVPLTIAGVNMSIFLREENGLFRVSIRSRKGFSARALAAAYFHGGGHEMAAGGKLYFPGDIPTPDGAASYIEKITKQLPR